MEPFPRFDPVRFAQQPADKRAVNALLPRGAWRQRLTGAPTKLRQSRVSLRYGAILLRRHLPAVEIKSLGQESAVPEPNAIPAAKHPAHGRDLDLQPPVIVPLTLDSGATIHLELAERPAVFVPLAANAVK